MYFVTGVYGRAAFANTIAAVFLKDLTLIEVGNDDDEEKNVLSMPIYEKLSRIVAVPYELERVFFVQQQLVAIDGVDSDSQDLLSDVACAVR